MRKFVQFNLFVSQVINLFKTVHSLVTKRPAVILMHILTTKWQSKFDSAQSSRPFGGDFGLYTFVERKLKIYLVSLHTDSQVLFCIVHQHVNMVNYAGFCVHANHMITFISYQKTQSIKKRFLVK